MLYFIIMKHGAITQIAQKLNKPFSTIHGIISGRRNASAPLADDLATITNSDIRIWLLGGKQVDRQDAVNCWAETNLQ